MRASRHFVRTFPPGVLGSNAFAEIRSTAKMTVLARIALRRPNLTDCAPSLRFITPSPSYPQDLMDDRPKQLTWSRPPASQPSYARLRLSNPVPIH